MQKDNFHNPADYEQWLNNLTGVDYERFVLGKWVQAIWPWSMTWSVGGTIDGQP
jgi:hypothetical protein